MSYVPLLPASGARLSGLHALPAFLSAALLALALTTSACGGGDDNTDPCASASALTVQVDYNGAQADVSLASLPGTPEGDLCLVPLDRVVEAAGLNIDLAQVVVDFRGTDGFQPTQVECALLEGSVLSQGQIDRRTGSLAWDPVLGLRGCYTVTSLAAILVQDATPTP